jgi:hypothetical protein
MNHSTRLFLAALLPIVVAPLSLAACETHDRVVVREPVRERVVVKDPPPPVVEEKVTVHP